MIELQRLVYSKCTGARRLSENDIACAVGGDAEDGALGVVESAPSRIHIAGQIPAVTVSAPAEVEREVAVGIVAVANKRVPARTLSGIIDGISSIQIVAEHGLPFVIGEICLLGITHVWTVSEEVDKGSTSLHIKRATFIGSIAHVHRHPAIAHQGGDGIHLRGIAGIRQRVRHIRVVIVGTAVIDCQRAVVALIAVGSATVLRILVIVDNLRHSGGHTTCVHMTSRTIGICGTKVIVILPLVPGGGQQRSHRIAVTGIGHRLT